MLCYMTMLQVMEDRKRKKPKRMALEHFRFPKYSLDRQRRHTSICFIRNTREIGDLVAGDVQITHNRTCLQPRTKASIWICAFAKIHTSHLRQSVIESD